MKILSLCCSAGLWDRVFRDAGHSVMPGCEIVAYKRRMYEIYNGISSSDWVAHNIADVPRLLHGAEFDGIIAGIPCQTRSRLRGMARNEKLVDLLPALLAVLAVVKSKWTLFENVAALDIPNHASVRLNAANFAFPHQSRLRTFTYSALTPPAPLFSGNDDDLTSYPCVAGRLYGPKRGAALQGHPEFWRMPFHSHQIQEALADGVHRGTAEAWLPVCERASL